LCFFGEPWLCGYLLVANLLVSPLSRFILVFFYVA
jgi:hypothetical protein